MEAVPSVTDDPFDYGADGAPSEDAVAKAFADLDRLTLEAERATAKRKRLEDDAKRAKEEEERFLTKLIPELLATMHLEKCRTSSGIDVAVKKDIKASLPGRDRIQDRLRAFAWLIEQGHGGVIKNKIEVELDRGQDERADELVVQLRAQGFEPTAIKDVNAMTLGALVRELMAEGKIVPREYLNIFEIKIAKLSRKD
jgi:hypothetical protein